MLHQVGNKLRHQIHNFSGELCKGMGTVTSRFIEEAIFGLSASGSVRLTEMGRSLEEDIPLHATHKRLSRNLADSDLGSRIETNIFRLGADRISEKTLLIVDPTDLQKKYAKKMQYLARVRDAIPDFRYYAVVDGIKTIFKRIGKGPLHPRGYESPPTPQLSLWVT